ncbi:MAG: chemotaxis-specific protein-glutamate methyltransferase CheB [Myxococcales bacterium]|nr:chemotaxis-specific protein-glutamate methyltransferase CheB [Myxococcales bacterium]
MPPKVIRILVVDDSDICRDAIRAALEAEGDIEVVGEASDGVEATRLVASLQPNLVTLDLQMPRMGGLETIEWIMRHHPTRILVVTDRPQLDGVDMTFASLSRGALELLPKAAWSDPRGPEARALVARVRSLSTVPLQAAPESVAPSRARPALRLRARPELVGVGASTGGPTALSDMLGALPKDFPLSVLVVQHMHPYFHESFAVWLAKRSRLPLRIATDGELLSPGEVRVAPQGKDLVVTRGGRLKLLPPPPDALHSPSADRLFHSMAKALGASSVGVLLSGMGADGAEGLMALHQAGALTAAQDKQTSAVYGMPRAAIELGAADFILPAAEIGRLLAECSSAATSSAPPRVGGSFAKVLVVDDSPVVLEAARGVLEEAGFQVTTLENPLEVARAVRRERPDLVLIDLCMPALGGDRVASIIRQHGLSGETLLLLYSDRPSEELEAKARECGADGFIEKGAGGAALLARVRELLG